MRLSEDSMGAATALEGAIAALDSADMALYAQAARRQLGLLRAGEAGATLVADADAFMRSRQIRNPERMSAIVVPGFPTG
jgi:hypothetical protein